ncbi:MAG: extensin family protein [Pseudomonadota bacterium]
MRDRIRRNLILVGALSAQLFGISVEAGAPLTSEVPRARPIEITLRALAMKNSDQQNTVDIAKVIAALEGEVLAPVPQQTVIQPVMGQRPKTAAQHCRNKALVGETVADIAGTQTGCGVDNPVRLTSVHGVQLSRAAVMDCTTADALADWTKNVVQKQFGKKRRDVVVIDVVASYHCRTRNNRPGAKISEHGKGRAIDVAAFLLDNGDRVSVLEDWSSGKYRKTMRAVHKGACGIFGTVLGPKSDRFHRDHFHFDTAQYRSGPYCR